MASSKSTQIQGKQLRRIIERLRGMGIEQSQREEAMKSLVREGNCDWAQVKADNDYFEGIIGRLVGFIVEKEQLKLEIESPRMDQAMDAIQILLGIERCETKKAVESLLEDNYNDWTVIEVDNYSQLIERIFSRQSGEIEQVPPAKSEPKIVRRKGKSKRSNTTNGDTSQNHFKKQRLTSGSPGQLVNISDLEKDDPHIKSKGKQPVFDTAPLLEEPKIEPAQSASAQIKGPLMELPTTPSPRAVSSAPAKGPVNLEGKERHLASSSK